MNYEILPDAQREYQDIEEWYLSESVERALTFRHRFDAEVELMLEDPERPRVREHGTRARRLGRLPIKIVYKYFGAERPVLIVAVAHLRRKPNYWSNRLEDL